MKEFKFRNYLEADIDEPETTDDQTAEKPEEVTEKEPEVKTEPTVKEETKEGGPLFKHNDRVTFSVDGIVKKVYDMAQSNAFSYLVSVKERNGEHEYLVMEKGIKRAKT